MICQDSRQRTRRWNIFCRIVNSYSKDHGNFAKLFPTLRFFFYVRTTLVSLLWLITKNHRILFLSIREICFLPFLPLWITLSYSLAFTRLPGLISSSINFSLFYIFVYSVYYFHRFSFDHPTTIWVLYNATDGSSSKFHQYFKVYSVTFGILPRNYVVDFSHDHVISSAITSHIIKQI